MRKFRLITAVVLSLLGGAIITVGIAWACVVWSETTPSSYEVGDREPPDLVTVIPAAWLVRQYPDEPGKVMFVQAGYRGVGVESRGVRVFETVNGNGSHGPTYTLNRQRAGWPFFAVECMVKGDLGHPWVDELGLSIPSWFGGTERLGAFGTNRLLPLRPLGGFALDTLISAAPLFACFVGVRWLIGSVRHKRHRCPACNYSKAGLLPSAPCPECGAPAA